MWKTYTGTGTEMGPVASPQSRGPGPVGGWHPTILYLIALLIAEALVIGFISRTFLR